jgi:hypothetical protein
MKTARIKNKILEERIDFDKKFLQNVSTNNLR